MRKKKKSQDGRRYHLLNRSLCQRPWAEKTVRRGGAGRHPVRNIRDFEQKKQTKHPELPGRSAPSSSTRVAWPRGQKPEKQTGTKTFSRKPAKLTHAGARLSRKMRFPTNWSARGKEKGGWVRWPGKDRGKKCR